MRNSSSLTYSKSSCGWSPAEGLFCGGARVAIARAIAKRPAVLLCDEPTGALDSQTGVIVLEALETVNRELGTTTVIITHNAAQAEIAERIIHLKDGEIAGIENNAHKKAACELTW